ncbi:hypothetical protein AAU61_02100 [Desulfocarbo indianensis]|nr:hypothetical protein AAU61_02100 [Desulfocarbo indianensis]
MPYLYLFDAQTGAGVYGPDQRPEITDFLLEAVRAQFPGALPWQSTDEARPAAQLLASIEEGHVVDVQADPAYAPPDPPLDPVEELTAVVSKNVLASPHDKRFLAQKEAAKSVMWWIRENPDCAAAQVLAQVEAAIEAETPGEPVVVCAQGLMDTYAYEAHQRGLISADTWEELKALILASTPAQLMHMLATV